MNQNLKQDWLVVWKTTWEIWKMFSKGLKSLENGTLMRSNYALQRSYASWQWWMMQNMKKNLHEEFDEFWHEQSKVSKICTWTGCFWPKYIMLELKKCFQKWHEEFGKFSDVEISGFILKSKMAELNQNQNSKQSERPDAVWKLYFSFEINEMHS